MKSPVLIVAAIVVIAFSAGCQSTSSAPATPLTAEEVAQKERNRKISAAQQRQALNELIRVLEIQLADADGEVGRLQSTMSLGGAFLEAYNEAFQKREDLRARLEEARLQLNSLPD